MGPERDASSDGRVLRVVLYGVVLPFILLLGVPWGVLAGYFPGPISEAAATGAAPTILSGEADCCQRVSLVWEGGCLI